MPRKKPQHDREQHEEQLREATDALVRSRTERERGTPFDIERAEFTINQAALLCAEIEIREGGFLDTDPEEMLERRWDDRYDRARDILYALTRAVDTGRFDIIPGRTGDRAIDPQTTSLSRDVLKGWCEEYRLRPAFLFPENRAQNATPHDGAGAAPEFDPRLYATRGQLIAAFGIFSGMNANWFHNLKYTPALLKARKFAGQGGRGHIREPYFCPFEVMLWLASPKRKKGSRVSEEKCWELLERHFPLVYAQHEVADPRE